jgi:uncharacterized membrane protein
MSLRTPQRLLLIAGTASALALMPAAASAGGAPGQYTTIDVPGATTTLAVGVNDLGVVSGFYADGNGNDHGFLDRDGTFTTINVPGAAGTVLTVVNDLGVAVGYYIDSSGAAHGLVDRHGRFTTINAPAPARDPGKARSSRT